MNNEENILNSLNYIENNITSDINIVKLASSTYFSKYYFQRLFHAYIGDSVMEYIKKRRLTMAGIELCTSEKSILEISLRYGYSSHGSFTRAFKSYHGFTPSECRKYNIFSTFTQQLQKEGLFMINEDIKYSKNMKEVLRNINEFVLEAKKTADATVKIKNDIEKSESKNFLRNF